MPNAVTTQGQGATSYIAMPTWGFNASAGTTGTSKIEIEFKIISYRSSSFAYLLASSGSTQNALRVDPATGRLQYRAGATNRIETGDNAIQLGQIYKARLEYNKATTRTTLYLNNAYVGEYIASNTLQFNQINRFSTTANTYVDMVLYSLTTSSDSNYSTYVDSWLPETAPSAGTSWTSSGGTRVLTLTSFTGATDSWWVFYSNFYIGEATISVSASAQATLASSKVGNASVSAVAAAVSAAQGSKVGSAVLSMPITAGILLSASKNTSASITVPINAVLGIAANKVGVAPLYVEAIADISLYAGNTVSGAGTFSVTATALVSVQGEKVGQSQVQFVAAAALFCSAAKLSGSDVSVSANATAQLQAAKIGQSTTSLAASASASIDGYKVGLGTVAVLASATISLSGSNPAAVPAPVTVAFVRSSSRHTHSVRTSCRYSYNLKTSSGGARV